MEEEFDYKCKSCGAAIEPTERFCSYCGSVNRSYKKPTPKVMPEENVEEKNDEENFDLGDIFGGFFGGMMIGSAIKKIGRTIMHPHLPPSPFNRRRRK